MEAGICFVLADSSVDDHLWVILSDPKLDPQRVLVVNLTTATPRKEQVCLLQPGDHPWVRHVSCVNYADSWVRPLAQLYEWKDKGLLKITDSMPLPILQRMREAVLNSTRIPLENADVLLDQGLIGE